MYDVGRDLLELQLPWPHTSGLFYGFSLRVLFTGSLVQPYYLGYLLGATVLSILSIYMGPVDPQVDYHQAIQSILCCAYITITIVIFIRIRQTWYSLRADNALLTVVGGAVRILWCYGCCKS
jgi:ABC-type Fe3+-siderophore transport system permease subunit